MLWVPTLRALVMQVALRVLPAPVTADAAQPAIDDTTPSLKFTVPVGLVPITVAVNVTLAPNVDELSELASVVVVPGGVVHDGNLNEPMRVCQLPLVPFVWLL